MWTTAFDASGKEEDQDFVVVGGFVAQSKLWDEFDCEWRARLAKDHLPRFHMSEWHHGTGLFSNRTYWDDGRRQAIIDDLLTLIRHYVAAKFACAIINKSYAAQISATSRKQFLLNAYVLAARVVVDRSHEWTVYRDNKPVRHVFEEGDKGKGMLLKRMQIEGLEKPSFRWGHDTLHKKTKQPVPGFTPLQAADIYAYEVFRFARNFPVAGNSMGYVLRELDSVHGEPRTFSINDLARLNDMINEISADPTFWDRHQSL